MEKGFNGSESIGEIVSIFPQASNLFKDHRIDFCCGGNRILSTVLRQQNIDEEKFLEQLNQAYEKSKQQSERDVDWRSVSSSELIDHVVNSHHAFLYRELPILSEFVTKILRVHGPSHPELAKLHKLFHQLKMELVQHLIAEEETVFPLIKEYEKTGSRDALDKAVRAIEELESEHQSAGDLLKEMRSITNDYELPVDACRTYTLSFQKLEALESDLFQHIHLENNILFPRLTPRLTPD